MDERVAYKIALEMCLQVTIDLSLTHPLFAGMFRSLSLFFAFSPPSSRIWVALVDSPRKLLLSMTFSHVLGEIEWFGNANFEMLLVQGGGLPPSVGFSFYSIGCHLSRDMVSMQCNTIQIQCHAEQYYV